MGGLPLHPAVVHIPLGLALVLPLFAVVGCIGLWKKWIPRRAWLAIVLAQAILLASGLFARYEGEEEEERVERIVGERNIEEHEDWAEIFLWAAAGSLLLSIFTLAGSEAAERWLATATVLASLVVAGLALQTGHSGGELVYVHGAASAYTKRAPPPAGSGTPTKAGPASTHFSDDDHD